MFAIFSRVVGGSYAWISPLDVQERFLRDLHFVRTGNRFNSEWARISLSQNEVGSSAAGPIWNEMIPSDVSLEDFRKSFGVIVNSTDDCFDALVYFAFRPLWYTPTREEVLRARECLYGVINRIPISVNMEDDEAIYLGSLMSDAVSRLMRVLYTQDADDHIAAPVMLSPLCNHSMGFRDYISSSERFQAILPLGLEPGDISEIIEYLYPIDAYYLQKMSNFNYNHSRMIHFPDFIDSVYRDLVSMAVGPSAEAFLFRLIASRAIDFEKLDRHNHMRKRRAVANPGILFHRFSIGFQNSVSRQRNAFRQMSAGGVQHLLSHETRAFAKSCMPTDNEEFRSIESQFPWLGDERDESTFTIHMYYFMDKPRQLLSFYECVLNGIASGNITTPTSDLVISGFGFLMRMVSSTEADLLRRM